MTALLDALALPFLWAAWLLSPYFRVEWKRRGEALIDVGIVNERLSVISRANERLYARHMADVEAVEALQRDVAELEDKLRRIEEAIHPPVSEYDDAGWWMPLDNQ